MKWKVTDRAQSITSAASQKTNAHKTSDVILCIMLPSATFSERLTSGIVIKNYTGDFLNAVYKHGPAFETAVNNVRTLYNARVIREGRPDLVRPILNFAEVRRLREEAASLLQAAAEKMQIAATIGNASAQGRALFAEGQAMEKKAAVASARADALYALVHLIPGLSRIIV